MDFISGILFKAFLIAGKDFLMLSFRSVIAITPLAFIPKSAFFMKMICFFIAKRLTIRNIIKENCITTKTFINRLLLFTDKFPLIRLSGENPEMKSAGYIHEINPTIV